MAPSTGYIPILRLLAVVVAAALVFSACGGGDLPVERIKKALKDAPTYSIILEDMKEEGNFFKKYLHMYRVIQDDQSDVTDWLEVPETFYRSNEALLGMTIAAKKDGEEITAASPPGYEYVGDSKYGRWRTDHSGNSFWEFYGKYALMTSLLGSWNRPIYRNDYDMYQRNRARNTPYFGTNNQYGTNGSATRKTKPDFYSRRNAAQQMKKASFKDRVAGRTGRTRTNFRGRGGGFGK